MCRRVEGNTIKCFECNGCIKNVQEYNEVCLKCKSCKVVVQKSPKKKINLVGDILKVVGKFWCWGEVLSKDGRWHNLVLFRIRAGQIQRGV